VRLTFVDIAGINWATIRSMDELSDADKRFSRFTLSDKHCFVLDLDGTVYLGNRPIHGTVEFIDHKAKKRAFYFVTNNTSKLPEDYRLRLNAMGIPVDSDHIITPLAPLIAYLQARAIQNTYLIGNARFEAYLRQALPELQMTADPDACEALIVAYDTELTYDKLQDAAILLQQNARLLFLATHGDLVCPTEHGFVPDCGCILSVLEKTTGRRPTAVFGKPSPHLLERVTEQCGVDHMAIVGDRLYTDGKMAHNVGCSFVCVLSGETTREQIDDLDEDEFPTLIVKDLGELLT
jgi:HAD superfamily hydrolase (TIGR01450 family)